MILLVSSPLDEQTIHLGAALHRKRASFEVFDYAPFPASSRVSLYYGSKQFDTSMSACMPGGNRIDFSAFGAVWWGRPEPFVIPPEIVGKINQDFILRECTEAIAGMWQSLRTFWINHPYADQRAGHKPYQLTLAQDVGLEVPETLITNEPDLALQFCRRERGSRTVYKSFLATQEVWRETRLVGDAELALLDAVRYSPVIFQDYVDAVADVRVTAIDGEFFTAAFLSDEAENGCDYRVHLGNVEARNMTLPIDVAERLGLFMERLDLVYGAIDFRLTPDGRWVFLEINPCGQWLYVERATGLSITNKLAEVLISRSAELQS